jgi:hypothetical protein
MRASLVPPVVAKGSHATYGRWEPRVCEGCGKRISLSGAKAIGAAFRFDVERGVGRARHADCKWKPKGH